MYIYCMGASRSWDAHPSNRQTIRLKCCRKRQVCAFALNRQNEGRGAAVSVVTMVHVGTACAILKQEGPKNHWVSLDWLKEQRAGEHSCCQYMHEQSWTLSVHPAVEESHED